MLEIPLSKTITLLKLAIQRRSYHRSEQSSLGLKTPTTWEDYDLYVSREDMALVDVVIYRPSQRNLRRSIGGCGFHLNKNYEEKENCQK